MTRPMQLNWVLAAAALSAGAQQLPRRPIEFTVVVLDAKGKPVADLRRDELSIEEEGHPRQIAIFQFEGGPEPILAPCAAGFFTNRPGCLPGPPRNVTANSIDPSLAGLEALANHLASSPGRRSIVWAATPSGSEADIEALAQRLATMGVSIYPAARADAASAAIVDLANRTGGRVAESAERGAVVAANDLRGAYRVGFYAEGEPDGRWHQVAVTVRRHDAVLTCRQGYLRETPANRDWSDAQWSGAMEEKLNSAKLHVDGNCDLAPGARDSSLTCKLQVPTRDLGFLVSDGELRGEIETAVVEQEGVGRYQMQRGRFPIRLSADQAASIESKVTQVSTKWTIGRGTPVVRFIVRDRLTANYATLDVPVARIPPPGTGSGESAPAIPPPDADPFIERAREATLLFLKTLPNYVVRENTTRESQTHNTAMFALMDRISAEVVYDSGKESVRDLTLNGQPSTVGEVERAGTWSTGQFAGTLQALFERQSAAVFHERGKARVAGREARVYDYSIEKVNSGWVLYAGEKTYVTAYRGTVWLDSETARALKFEMKARGIPADFPFDRAESSTVFGMVHIGDAPYLLPQSSMALVCNRVRPGETGNRRGGPVIAQMCARNVIRFTDYRQFGAESNISFGPAH